MSKADPSASILIKKYSNRRLYSTEESRYITLNELAELIRAGREVEVVHARSGEELTQSTLAQLVIGDPRVIEHLPVEVLTQMIRLPESSLTVFIEHGLSAALGRFLQLLQQGLPPAQAAVALAQQLMTPTYVPPPPVWGGGRPQPVGGMPVESSPGYPAANWSPPAGGPAPGMFMPAQGYPMPSPQGFPAAAMSSPGVSSVMHPGHPPGVPAPSPQGDALEALRMEIEALKAVVGKPRDDDA